MEIRLEKVALVDESNSENGKFSFSDQATDGNEAIGSKAFRLAIYHARSFCNGVDRCGRGDGFFKERSWAV